MTDERLDVDTGDRLPANEEAMLRRTAVHMAGHAVMAALQGLPFLPTGLTIKASRREAATA